jgi:Putative prokaryotic signal transducing protein
MKLIFSSTSLVEVSELKDMLDAADIACYIANEASSRLAGGIPMSETMPELWIEDDSRLAEAELIKRDWQSPPPPAGTAWTCPKCSEKQEAQFTSCWKCGTKRP